MPHYVLIDAHSGFVWEETDAENPIEACRIVDEKVGTVADEYWEANRSEWTIGNGYFIHLAPSDWTPVEDGQRAGEIERVAALPLVAVVHYRPIDKNDAGS